MIKPATQQYGQPVCMQMRRLCPLLHCELLLFCAKDTARVVEDGQVV